MASCGPSIPRRGPLGKRAAARSASRERRGADRHPCARTVVPAPPGRARARPRPVRPVARDGDVVPHRMRQLGMGLPGQGDGDRGDLSCAACAGPVRRKPAPRPARRSVRRRRKAAETRPSRRSLQRRPGRGNPGVAWAIRHHAAAVALRETREPEGKFGGAPLEVPAGIGRIEWFILHAALIHGGVSAALLPEILDLPGRVALRRDEPAAGRRPRRGIVGHSARDPVGVPRRPEIPGESGVPRRCVVTGREAGHPGRPIGEGRFLQWAAHPE